MMKRILALGLILGLGATGALLPTPALAGEQAKSSGWHVERSVDIQARPEIVFAHVGDLNRWPQWTVWNQAMDPTTQWLFGGDVGQVGHSMEWSGKKMGWGRLVFTAADPMTGVTYDMWMMKEKNPPGSGSLTFTAIEGGTRVTWTDAGPLKGLGKLWKNKINTMLVADFDTNLTNLKAAAEADELKKRAEEEAARAAAEAEAARKAAEEEAARKAAAEAEAARLAAEEEARKAAEAATKGKKKK